MNTDKTQVVKLENHCNDLENNINTIIYNEYEITVKERRTIGKYVLNLKQENRIKKISNNI